VTLKQDRPAAKLASEQYPRKGVQCEDGKTGEERGRNYAQLMTSPELAALRVINSVERNSGVDNDIDVPTLMAILRDQSKGVNQGDLRQAEAMLMNQATALQSLFARLTENAFSASQLPQFDAFMRLALRAQNQCRATLETLSAIKNPPVVIAKQANIAHGHQQVNNGMAIPKGGSYARENEIRPNELLTEAKNGKTVDIGATKAAIRDDTAVEAVEKINGAAHNRGEEHRSKKRIQRRNTSSAA
jgi:hypothetical protein